MFLWRALSGKNLVAAMNAMKKTEPAKPLGKPGASAASRPAAPKTVAVAK